MNYYNNYIKLMYSTYNYRTLNLNFISYDTRVKINYNIKHFIITDLFYYNKLYKIYI